MIDLTQGFLSAVNAWRTHYAFFANQGPDICAAASKATLQV
jgi:hypothetical protein